MKRFASLLLALLLCVSLAACGGNGQATPTPAASAPTPAAATPAPGAADTPQPAEEEPGVIKVGGMFCLTGFQSGTDIGNARELEAFADLINKNGGWEVGGKKYMIEVILADAESDPAMARTVALYLIDQGAQYVFEGMEFITKGARDVFEEYGVFHSCQLPMDPKNAGPDFPHYFFSSAGTFANYVYGTVTGAELFPQIESVVMCENDNGNNDAQDVFMKLGAEKAGIEHIPHIMYPPDTTDFSAVALSIINSGADAFVGAGPLTNNGAILRELRNMGSDIVYISPTPQNAYTLMDIVGEDNFYNIITMGVMIDGEGHTQWYRDMYEHYKSSAGEEIANTMSGNAPNALLLVLNVMKAAGSVEVEDVVKTWVTLDSVDGLFGSGPVCGTEMYGSPQVVASPTGITLVDGDGNVTFEGYIQNWLD